MGQNEFGRPDRRFQELFKREALSDRWIKGEAWLYINVGVRAGLLDIEAAQFCAWLEYRSHARCEPPQDAVSLFPKEEARVFRHRDDRLNRSVLVEPRQLVKYKKKVAVEVPLPADVWLTTSDACDVCSPNPREPRTYDVVELRPGISDREVDVPFLFLREIGCPSPLVERPREVVQSAAEIVDGVSEKQSPKLGEWVRNIGDRDIMQ